MAYTQVESAEEIISSEPEIINDVAEEIGSPPVEVEATDAVILIPIEETELSISEWGMIGLGSAGVALLVSLGVAIIIRIFWRSAS